MKNIGTIISSHVRLTISVFAIIYVFVIVMDIAHTRTQNASSIKIKGAIYKLQVIHAINGKSLPVPIPIPEGGVIRELSEIKSLP